MGPGLSVRFKCFAQLDGHVRVMGPGGGPFLPPRGVNPLLAAGGPPRVGLSHDPLFIRAVASAMLHDAGRARVASDHACRVLCPERYRSRAVFVSGRLGVGMPERPKPKTSRYAK